MLGSTVGKICVIIFASLVIIMSMVAIVCGFEGCGPYLVYPVMPWAYIFTQEFSINFPWAMYPALLLLNVCIVYMVGVIIEWLYHRYQEY